MLSLLVQTAGMKELFVPLYNERRPPTRHQKHEKIRHIMNTNMQSSVGIQSTRCVSCYVNTLGVALTALTLSLHIWGLLLLEVDIGNGVLYKM
jgi:hypothetical protein